MMLYTVEEIHFISMKGICYLRKHIITSQWVIETACTACIVHTSWYFKKKGWDPHGNWYFITWLQAEADCQNRSGHLVSIYDKREMDIILHLLPHDHFVPAIYTGMALKVSINSIYLFLINVAQNESSCNWLELETQLTEMW